MASLWELFVAITGDNSGFKKSIHESHDELLKFGDFAQEIGEKLVGYLAFASVAEGVLKVAESFETASIQIQRATGATGESLDGLEASLKHVYAGSAQSAETIGAAMTKITQKTGATGDALESLTASALKFAKVTGTDVASSVETNQKLFASWGISVDQQAAKLDLMYVITQKTGIGASQLGESLLAIGPTLRNFGIDFDYGATLIGSFWKAGLDATDMVMGLNKAFAAFAAAGKEPRAALLELVTQMSAAATRADALNLAIADGFTAKTAGKFVDAVRSGAFELKGLKEATDNSKGALDKMAAQTRTLSGEWEKFKHGIALGLADEGPGLLRWITDAIGKFNELAGKIGTFSAFFAGGAGAARLLEDAQKMEEWHKKNLAGQSFGKVAPADKGSDGVGAATLAAAEPPPEDAFKWIPGMTDDLAVLISTEKQQIASHQSMIAEIAASGKTVEEFFTAGFVDAERALVTLDDTAGENIPAIGDDFTALAKQIDFADKEIGKLNKSMNAATQEILDNSPAAKFAAQVGQITKDTDRMVSQMFNSIERGIASDIVHWKGFGATIKGVFQKLGEDVISIMLHALLAPLEKAFASILANLAVKLATFFGLNAATASATDVAEVTGQAGVGGAAAAAAAAPFFWWNPALAVAIGAAMAGSIEGTFGPIAAFAGGGVVGYDNTLGLFNKEEMVLPGDISNPLRAMIKSGDLSSGGGVSIHIGTMNGVAKETVGLLADQIIRGARRSGAKI